MKPFDLVLAHDVPAAVEAGSAGYRYKAGGVDLLDRLKERIAAPGKLVDVMGIKPLGGVSQDAAGLHIGATATLAEVSEDAKVKGWFAALGHAAGEAATPQIRNMATFGGNLLQRPRCWYFRSHHFHCLKKGGATCYAVDGEHEGHALFGGGPCHIVHPSNVAPALVAADANLYVQHKGGSRVIPASDAFVLPRKNLAAEHVLRPGELLVKVTLPKKPTMSGYAEVRHKQSFDWPLATATAALVDGRWRIVLGAVAPVPWRAEAAEEALAKVSGKPDKAQIAAAAKASVKGANPLPRAAWRLALVQAVVRRALEDAV